MLIRVLDYAIGFDDLNYISNTCKPELLMQTIDLHTHREHFIAFDASAGIPESKSVKWVEVIRHFLNEVIYN